ncbi:MAG: response regulator [Rhodomicrobium sp.]
MLSESRRLKRILVVEDQSMIAYDLRALLMAMGYEVAGPASSISNAMEAIISDPPDAAVLDIALGKETSFSIAEALAERSIPFIFLTGYGESILPPALRTYPLLTKPVRKAELKAALESALADR